MNFRRILFVALWTFAGWRLSAAPVPASTPALRLHWLGLNGVSADTNSAQFLKIWHLPETVALVHQTLDKLSRWPAGGTTNATSQALRPLLDDLITSEFYLEFSALTNSQPSTFNLQLLLALHLPSPRENLWQTNLATAFTTLTGQKPVARKTGWRLTAAGHFGQVELTRSGDWTVLGIGPETHASLSAFVATLPAATRQPSRSNVWLEADFPPAHLQELFHRTSESNSKPKTQSLKLDLNGLLSPSKPLHLTLSGTNDEVLTLATLPLAQPLPTPLPTWNLPTNLLHDSLSSFTAVRGLGDWLANLPAWRQTQLAPAPEQAFFWAYSGIPFQTYVAVPLPNAGHQLSRLSDRLTHAGNSWLTNHAQGSFQWNAQLPGLVWNDALIINPFLKTATANGQDWLLGGLYPLNPLDATLAPDLLLRPLRQIPDLVYYQAEQTGVRADAGFFILQLCRVVFRQPQLPTAAAATIWLKQVEPDLGACTTVITRSGPQQLTLRRRSTLGLSALELHLLADWLESPAFPYGLHTFLAPPD